MKKRHLGIKPRATAAALLLLAFANSSAFQSHQSHKRHPFVDRKLSGPVTLKPQEWLELSPAQPLKAVRDTQEVTLFPDPPIKMALDGPLARADGRPDDIEAELVGSNGVSYHSRPGVSASMTGDLKIVSRSLVFKDLPKDASFKTVRIRSSAAYPVKKILWRCYNWGEAHH